MDATTFALPATPRQIAYARSLALRNQRAPRKIALTMRRRYNAMEDRSLGV